MMYAINKETLGHHPAVLEPLFSQDHSCDAVAWAQKQMINIDSVDEHNE